MSKPTVVIVGRPNVGKSQLFNRMTGTQTAIVQDEPGITRDRIYADCTWNGRTFALVDTGGIDNTEEDPVKMMAQKQVRRALEDADLLLFIVDTKEGLNPVDEEIATHIRKLRKPILLVANKTDTYQKSYQASEFNSLGLGEPFCVSALHGMGVGDLLDEILEKLDMKNRPAQENDFPRITLAGRRNVGKSSMLNAISGEERSIVHDTAGTTRDSVESIVERHGENFTVTDTSGLRRKGRIDEKVEYYSAIRTIKAIEEADCVLLVLNAAEGIVAQDLRVAEQIQTARKASIIVVNKWDLVEESVPRSQWREEQEKWRQDIKGILHFLSYSPVVFTSAKRGKGIDQIFAQLETVMQEYNKRVETPVVNRLFQEAQSLRPAPSYKGRQLRIYYASQTATAPPKFTIKVNSTDLIHFSYRRYLENYIRKALGFTGAPIIFNFRKNKDK